MPAPPPVKLTLRLDFPGGRLGPGKVDLLEAIDRTGSISGGGRAMKMSYRRAWMLVDELNRIFGGAAVEAQPGGAHGGGARLTELGQDIVRHYRAIEAGTIATGGSSIEALRAMIRTQGEPDETTSPQP